MPKPFEHIFWERGFRPFFFLGGLYAIWSILVWTAQMHGALQLPFANPIAWHGHEMVYGYTMAIVAGFLLTAVANWTGWAPVRKGHLAGLALLWLAGRAVMYFPDLPLAVSSLINLAFIPVLTVSLAVPLLKSWNRRNFVFLFLLLTMWLCQGLILLDESITALYVAIFVIIAMISLIGGRIIPTFTVAGLRMKGKQVTAPPQPRMDIACLLSLIVLIVLFAVTGVDALVGAVALISAGLHTFRLRSYNITAVWGEPMLWVLHLGYLWLIIGLFLMGMAGFGLAPLSPALHALTAGSIGAMTLGMMVRVSLGHTGRDLKAGKAAITAFVFIQLAALARVAGPFFLGQYYLTWIGASGALWAISFTLYILFYSPVLWGARVVRKPAQATPPPSERFKNMKPLPEDERS